MSQPSLRKYSDVLLQSQVLKPLSVLITVSYALFLLTATHMPMERLPQTETPDKLLHFLAYGVLGFCAGVTLLIHGRESRLAMLLVWLGLLGFGAIDEITQAYVGRFPEFWDWFADLVGLTCGFLCARAASYLLSRFWQPLLQVRSRTS